MVQAHITIINKLGLHARAATKFANTANKYGANIKVTFANKTIDGKSIMSLMLLAAAKGSEILLNAEGNDAAAAIDDLKTLINNRFDEAE